MTITYLALFLLTSLSAFAQAPNANSQPPAASAKPQPIHEDDDNAKKARTLLNKMIAALGGEAYLNIRDIEQQGRTNGFSHGDPSGASEPFWRFYKYPDKDRIELTKRRDWIFINNGEKGYETTFRGTKPQDPKEIESYLRRREYSLDHILREWLKDPAIAFFDDGPIFIEAKQAEQITIINSKNQSVTLFIDSVTSLPIKKSVTSRDPVDKQKDEDVEIYDGYRLVQGINTPFNVTRIRNGAMQNQRFLFKVVYGQGLPDSLFEPPSSTPGSSRK